MPQFINPPSERPFHSHEYAKATGSDTIGAQSPQTFEQRLAIDSNRQVVKGYHHSLIVRGAERGLLTTRRSDSPQSRMPVINRRDQSSMRPRITFNEPSGRRYNPYA